MQFCSVFNLAFLHVPLLGVMWGATFIMVALSLLWILDRPEAHTSQELIKRDTVYSVILIAVWAVFTLLAITAGECLTTP